jgi:hypothetical protein
MSKFPAWFMGEFANDLAKAVWQQVEHKQTVTADTEYCIICDASNNNKEDLAEGRVNITVVLKNLKRDTNLLLELSEAFKIMGKYCCGEITTRVNKIYCGDEKLNNITSEDAARLLALGWEKSELSGFEKEL